MLRSLFAVSRNVLQATHHVNKMMYISPMSISQPVLKCSNGVGAINSRAYCKLLGQPKLELTQPSGNLLPSCPSVNAGSQTRTLTKFSLSKGKRKAVKAVTKKFYRLNWGIWIRAKCGKEKKLYKKSARRKRRLRQTVFCNATQSWLLDSMVTKYWRRPKYYVDDPYEPYHSREEYFATRRKPWVPQD